MGIGCCAIGLGGLGHVMLEVLAAMDDVEVVAGADVSEHARALFESTFDAPAYDDYRAMLAEHAGSLDAAIIVTPHTLHYEQTRDCLRAGLHVFLEKPMVTDVSHALSLIRLADETGRQLQIGYQRHFHPAFTEIRRIIDGGRVGEIHAVNCYLGQDWVSPHSGTWRVDPALSGGGQLYDSGSHLLDALLWTTSAVPRTVSGEMRYLKPGIDINSALALTLERDGSTITASVGISGDGVELSPREGYVFWGTGGRINYDGRTLSVAEKGALTYESEITAGTDFHTLTARKLENFVAAIRGEEEPAVPGEIGLQVTALTEAAYAAAEEGRTVDVQALIEGAETAIEADG